MLIDWCCKTQGEQASNWPKSRREWRGEGWRRAAEGWDWAEMGGLAGNLLEGEGAKEEWELGASHTSLGAALRCAGDWAS